MTSYLSLEGVSYVLPNGEALFSDINDNFDQLPTGLVGRNGSGKTVLAHILAGQLTPTHGRCVQRGTLHYLAQQVSAPQGAKVADLAGVQGILEALKRIEAGGTAQVDFDTVGEKWDLRQQLRYRLVEQGLEHLDVDTPASVLSGGEMMRIALIGAQLSNADFLILDEPTNHLDQPNRQALIKWIQRWNRGLLVISHDRHLLGYMARIVELSSLGLRSYGGNYSFYAQAKAQERQQALAELARAKLEKKHDEQSMREQRERQEKRQSRGNRDAKEANQAKVLLGRQKERSEQSMGKLHKQQAETQIELSKRVRDAGEQVEDEIKIHLHSRFKPGVAKRIVAELERIQLPFVADTSREINLLVTGQQRIGMVGPNGCGKSTLLRVLANEIEPQAGLLRVTNRSAYLDQSLNLLDPRRSVLEQLHEKSPSLSESDLRMRLAHLGLNAQRVAISSGLLSGGERLKAALACVLYAETHPELLLLDEPSNHLDLPSLQALQDLLSSYQGALIVASHDNIFLAELGLTHLLVGGSLGWRLAPAEPIRP